MNAARGVCCPIMQDKGVIQEALKAHYKDHEMALQGDLFLEKIVQVKTSPNLTLPSMPGTLFCELHMTACQ